MKSIFKLLTGVLGASVSIFRGRKPTLEPQPQIAENQVPQAVVDVEGMVGPPAHWPNQYNVCSDPCDMIDGPCACGAWHSPTDEWVQNGIKWFGLHESLEQKTVRLLKEQAHDSSVRATG